MPTRNVVLTNHQSELIDRLVKSGRYQNASEVLREGLRLVERLETEARSRLKALRDAARVGIADADAGRISSFDTPDVMRRQLSDLADEAIMSATRQKAAR